MFCQNCGSALDDGVKFCPNCGAAVFAPQPEEPAEQPVYEEPAGSLCEQPAEPVKEEPVVAAPAVDPKLNALAKGSLIFGIIGLSCTCTFWLSLLGIIFSAIGRGKVKAYLAAGGELHGKAKVGSILSKFGLIFGIILFVFFVLWLILMCYRLNRSDFSNVIRYYY